MENEFLNAYDIFDFEKCVDFKMKLGDENSKRLISALESNNSVTVRKIITENFLSCDTIIYHLENIDDNESLNSVITMTDDPVNCFFMFGFCNNFNKPIHISNNANMCYEMFYCCYNFNQPLVLGDNVNYCARMLYGCNNFNSSVTMGNGVYACDEMFRGCTSLNALVTLGKNVKYCNNMFYYCSNFNQPLRLSNQVINCYYMLAECPNFGSDIYFDGIEARSSFTYSSVRNMLYNTKKDFRKNIHFNNVFNNVFNCENSYSIVGRALGWTPMEDSNGFYNPDFNIYCYNNYEGGETS